MRRSAASSTSGFGDDRSAEQRSSPPHAGQRRCNASASTSAPFDFAGDDFRRRAATRRRRAPCRQLGARGSGPIRSRSSARAARRRRRARRGAARRPLVNQAITEQRGRQPSFANRRRQREQLVETIVVHRERNGYGPARSAGRRARDESRTRAPRALRRRLPPSVEEQRELRGGSAPRFCTGVAVTKAASTDSTNSVPACAASGGDAIRLMTTSGCAEGRAAAQRLVFDHRGRQSAPCSESLHMPRSAAGAT